MSQKSLYLYRILRSILLFFPIAGLAQQSPSTIPNLEPMVVTGMIQPTALDEAVVPVDSLTREQLNRYLSSSLGETTEKLVGVRSTSFGPGASRPVIRGFDGPRIRVLESGLDILDASASSPDHATSIDPFFADSIEILRGPATLLYGSSAIGGVVNVIDGRIPRDAEAPASKGTVLGRYHSVDNGWDFMGKWQWTRPDYALSVGGLRHDSNAIEIPVGAESARLRAREEAEAHEEEIRHDSDEDPVAEGNLENSFVETASYSTGATLFLGDSSRLSGGIMLYESRYGVPGHDHEHASEEESDHDEEDHEADGEDAIVTIDMQQVRYNLESLFSFDHPVSESLSVRMNFADYEHTEFEGDAIGTRFDRSGWDARAEWRHRFHADQSGVWGIQSGNSDFRATGEEAFTPPSDTRDLALFAMESREFRNVTLQGGLRAEHREIQVHEPDLPNYDQWGWSLSGGALYPFGESWNLGMNIARSERHPVATERYADGPHAATRQFERGDSSLESEISYGLDLSLRRTRGPVTGQLTLFYNRFDDFISAAPTGAKIDGLPVFQYEAVDAAFYGLEFEATWHLVHTDEQNLDLRLMFDSTQAQNRTRDEWLPRIPSKRTGIGALYAGGPWRVGSDLYYAFDQNRVAPNELPTDGYTRWDLFLEYRIPLKTLDLLFTLQGKNLLDEEIRHHTSYLKDRAPQAGRGLTAGFQVQF